MPFLRGFRIILCPRCQAGGKPGPIRGQTGDVAEVEFDVGTGAVNEIGVLLGD